MTQRQRAWSRLFSALGKVPTASALAVTALAGVALAAACGGSGQQFVNGPSSDDGGGGGSGGSSGGFASGDDGSTGGFGSSGGTGSGADASSGGAAGCDASCSAAGGKCTGTVCSITENPGKVATATQTQLQGNGKADSAFVWLYPYDKTVFPKGLLSPTLQFGGGASDAESVHITSKTLDYTGYFAGGAANQVSLSLPQKSWVAVNAAVGSGDVASVQVTKISGGKVTGPISESWPIAQGNVRGTVFYETYGSAVAGGRNSVALLKISPGATTPTVFEGTMGACGAICHAASADGTTIASATSLGASASWNVQSGASMATANSTTFTYMGLYPDGTFGMTATNYGEIYTTNAMSRLFDTKTGASIAAPGWDSVINAGGTPSFSPDGKQIAFMREDQDGHTIAKADFVAPTKTFSNIVNLATGASGYVAWPAFTPDGKSVLYQVGSDSTFETDCQYTGDIYAVDVATKTVRRLDILDGYTGSSTASYLPSSDPGLNFAPTMLPEAVGGYFWAIFTSHRSYGSMLASKANSDGLGVSNCFSAQGDEANGKLWVAAIDIGAAPGTDPSHPAFYLDGQELQADNLRGYWVLPACQAMGTSCESGDQCCSGFCRAGADGGTPSCVPPPKGCANEFESCTTASNCCASTDQCINGRCATPAPE
jgi:WD40-like Beta Propeller Repeat